VEFRFVTVGKRPFIEITLEDQRRHRVPLDFYPSLVRATPQQRRNWEWIGRGSGLHWPDLDLDLSVDGILAGNRERVIAPYSLLIDVPENGGAERRTGRGVRSKAPPESLRRPAAEARAGSFQAPRQKGGANGKRRAV
jgi:hypothetical protein